MASMPSFSRVCWPSREQWASSDAKGLAIALQNGVATLFKFDGQTFRINCQFHAGGEANKVICVRQRIRFVEVVNRPSTCDLPSHASAKTAHVEITDGQNCGSVTEVAQKVGPELDPAIERATKEKKRIFTHLLMLVAQIAFNDIRTAAHPVFIALCGLDDVHVRFAPANEPTIFEPGGICSIGKFP